MEKHNRYGLTFYKTTTNENPPKGYQIAKEFVEELFYLLSKYIAMFCKNGNIKYKFCDLPYAYSERRLDSVLLPALSKLCEGVVLTELPINRKFKKDYHSGRIDYWCVYKNYSFVIELKQGYDAFHTATTKKISVLDRWSEMIHQLDNVLEDITEFAENTKGVIRIGLHIITSYKSDEGSLYVPNTFNEKVIQKTALRLNKDISQQTPQTKPDMLLCWKIPTYIVKQGECIYPGLWGVAKIYSPFQHEGAKTK